MGDITCQYTSTCKKYRNKTCPYQDESILAPFCVKLFKINTLQDEALLSEKQRERIIFKVDKDGTDRDAFKRLKEIESDIVNFVDKGGNLYIYSHFSGNSKTSWAIRLMNTYFENIWYKSDLKCRGLFVSVPRYLISLKDSFSQTFEYIEHVKDNVMTADLVIWDDIATKGFTAFEMETLLNVINTRVAAGKANIYTSNLAGEDLKEAMGERLYSRVANMSEMIVFNSTDKRGILT